MKRTRLCTGTALVLVCLSLALMVHRRAVLGDAIHGPSGQSSWKVTVAVQGEAGDAKATLTLALPPDVRQQHVVEEHLPAGTDLERGRRGAVTDRRELTWHRETTNESQFRLVYSCRCVLGMHHPTAPMKTHTQELDAAPGEGEYLRPSDLVECFSDQITERAKDQVEDGKSALDQVQALYDFVGKLEAQPTPGVQSALQCLRDDGGNSAGKSRLLVALCRNRGIPARMLTGLVLVASQDQAVHHWVEAWVNGQWLPLCPTYHHFGPRQFPHNYLILAVGDGEWVRGQQTRFASGVSVEKLGEQDTDGRAPSALRSFWLRLSPFALGPAEQNLVKFLLLLPLATLIVCVFRIVIGLQTYGTFGTAILALAFLDLRALPWGIGVFVGIVLVGWGLRRVLDAYRLLMVPRTATLLTMIVIVLLVTEMTLSQHGVYLTQYIALFPMIILTHMVERFWTQDAEDGTASAFKTLVGTMLVTVIISLCLSGHWVANLMFRYPELLGVVLAAQLLLGRYTGYRLSELYRFRDLLRPELQLTR